MTDQFGHTDRTHAEVDRLLPVPPLWFKNPVCDLHGNDIADMISRPPHDGGPPAIVELEVVDLVADRFRVTTNLGIRGNTCLEDAEHITVSRGRIPEAARLLADRVDRRDGVKSDD